MTRAAALLAAGLLGLVAALWTWTRPGDPALIPTSAPDRVTVHLLNNGFHTDLAVPRAALEAGGGPLAQASRSVGPGDWILIGWGDARYFTDPRPMEHRIPDGLRAFFWPGNPSVIMLDPEAGDPSLRFPADRRRTLSLLPQAFAGLHGRIEQSMALTGGNPRLVLARPGPEARYFASREHFWIGYLCNSWTARVLNAAGLPVRPMRAVTAGEIMATIDRTELDTAARQD
ncbi:MAG: DUF2459 domain-containing protein [Brevundimonas sp.]|uniref:DUF2459 domain-containing protein n=1 Tax=Brevundimonas sp. TaxID=1871086 RepID=UPI0027364D3E|nr:DUF2459 domain-containing protein [Brevundimonas sp.]MDP3404737.1 DUF2459 domain-containing protein [Brevundimonas sp.]